jgi:hypothetical protein
MGLEKHNNDHIALIPSESVGCVRNEPNSYNTNYSDAINGHSHRSQDPLKRY